MNPHLVTLCLGGGLFAILVFIHAFVDFVCQTHFEAMNKHNKPWIRARHCLIYTLGFVPLLVVLHLFGAVTGLELFIALNVLFWSHFVEDTYYPVVLWSKFIRKPPCMSWRIVESHDTKGFYKLTNHTGIFFTNKTLVPSNVWRYELVKKVNNSLLSIKEARQELDKKGFLEFIEEFLGKYLMIAVDQIIHFCFLFPIVWMALN